MRLPIQTAKLSRRLLCVDLMFQSRAAYSIVYFSYWEESLKETYWFTVIRFSCRWTDQCAFWRSYSCSVAIAVVQLQLYSGCRAVAASRRVWLKSAPAMAAATGQETLNEDGAANQRVSLQLLASCQRGCQLCGLRVPTVPIQCGEGLEERMSKAARWRWM